MMIKATYFEVISTLRDVLKISSVWREYAKIYSRYIGEFTYGRLADFGAALSMANKLLCQQVLEEELDVHRRLKLVLDLIKKEIEISKIQESIAKAIKEKISGEQRRYLLNEQLKAIKKELGLETDDKTALSGEFLFWPNADRCPPHVLKVIEEELAKQQLLEASSSEFNVTRNYLDWLTALPWGDYSDENFDVHNAQKILDEDHYGLSDVKERILEFIAVGKLRGTSHVGKTSIGHSIARALNRKFYRFSVGGLADVAEIKGHRQTYIGAMPGKVVQCLKSVGTANPLNHCSFETMPLLIIIYVSVSYFRFPIFAVRRGHAGDPASALLELLDPEQNMNFLDHYLDVPIDLSKVILNCNGVLEKRSEKNCLVKNVFFNSLIDLQLKRYFRKLFIALQLVRKAISIETSAAASIQPGKVKQYTEPSKEDLIEDVDGSLSFENQIMIHLVKEKTIAIRRGEVKTIIFPATNRRDFDELSDNVKEGLDVHYVDDYIQIFELVFRSIDSSES
ncbi:hypothetical protein KFK09_015193 [Dendrobium nobile]|uniref:Lon N-terminal domain-containing protein n=1 Tax=Dendrobium nobile TaxID=94219 RepID=A0A8T3B6J6_DENNO|nr:hypothetical protein KFK09_015193 [Dendrobium nobile]